MSNDDGVQRAQAILAAGTAMLALRKAKATAAAATKKPTKPRKPKAASINAEIERANIGSGEKPASLPPGPLLVGYCKRNKHAIEQFAGFEDLAEITLQNAPQKAIVRFREVLAWHIPSHLRRLALQAISENVKAITKGQAIKAYGARVVDACPWYLQADNPHYTSAAPMRLYFEALLDAVKATSSC